MGHPCDGGGNRSQTKIDVENSPDLKAYFDEGTKHVLPGVCSISATDATWVVCPRRLLAFRHEGLELPPLNSCLQTHERALLLACGVPPGVRIGIWSEVYLRNRIDDTEINYHFDYLAAPLVSAPVQVILDEYNFEASERNDILKLVGRLNKGSGKVSEESVLMLPDLATPIIIEVMTASTSGSDSQIGTDIRSAFTNSILGLPHLAPGINKRQVWGRMVTQLFAKTALASNWKGSTFWIIQDELLRNIELTTRLKVKHIPESEECPINLAVVQYQKGPTGDNSGQLSVVSEISGKSGIGLERSNDFTDILLPAHLPDKKDLLRAVLRCKIAAIVQL